jgi:hypothetical protein
VQQSIVPHVRCDGKPPKMRQLYDKLGASFGLTPLKTNKHNHQ